MPFNRLYRPQSASSGLLLNLDPESLARALDNLKTAELVKIARTAGHRSASSRWKRETLIAKIMEGDQNEKRT